MKYCGCTTFYVAVLIFSFTAVNCSHFRGGVISWSPVDPTADSPPYEIELSYRIAWRRSFNSGLRCDATTVANQTLLRGEDSWSCSGASCTPSSNRLSFICTDFSIAEDWTLGKRSIRINITSISSQSFRIGYEGCCWIRLQRGGRDWDVWTSVNLTRRNDTGLINSSPVSISSPIVRVQHGCNHTFQIRVTDPDNDLVKCRWAIGSRECGGVCSGLEPQFSTLDERACVLRYRAIGGIGWYAVALMIEDFASPLDTEALSSVPLQFLVNVYSSTAPCTTKPEFLPPTRVDDSCIGIPVNAAYRMVIVAKGGSVTDNIRDISTVSPIGMNKSPLQQTDNSSVSTVDLTWTPSTQQLGQNLFCFTAESDGGFSSDQRCVTFLVGTLPPRLLTSSFDPAPNSEILATDKTWRVTFDTKFKRPLRRTFIFFSFKNGTLAHSIDVSSSADVQFPVFNERQLIINAPKIVLLERFEYYITLESGVARGLTFCGAESDALTSDTAWTFRIKDITPPILKFDTHSRRSNSSMLITWSYNEPTNSSCTIINPSGSTSFPDCNDHRWFGDNLVEGTYNLFVTGTDPARNVAQPKSTSWFVDLTAPSVILSKKPRSVSSETSSAFEFRCSESSCAFFCTLSDDPNLPSGPPSDCSQRIFTASSLQDGKTYTFNVYAVDSVGNRGQSTSFQWDVDLVKPVIQNVTSVLLNCGDDFRPSAIGTPIVTDSKDLNPQLTYVDHPIGNCTLRRTWTAVDAAGNTAQLNQSLVFNSPKDPQVTLPLSVVIPCSGALDTGMTGDQLIAAGLLRHPCNRSMTVTSSDLPPLDRCDMTSTRLWNIVDDCGQSLSFSQSIRVLSLQLPGSPFNGEVNVELNRELSWPDYPNTESYLVYVWPFGNQRPASPIATVAASRNREYQPPSDQLYPANTRMAWQVDFKLRDGYLINNQSIVPSPMWAFETKKFADLSVVEVNMPNQVFNGRSFDASWKVENIGSIGTNVFRWSDRVYLSTRSTPGGNRLLQRVVRHEAFLNPGDTYTGKATFNVPLNMLGQHYLIVQTDTYRQVTEVARDNNIAASTLPIDVKLTPPPDLQVTMVTLPTSTFSGQTVTVRWTVENKGVGATDVSSWFDGIYWSTDNTTATNNRLLKRQRRDVGLLQGGEYTSSTTISVPREIFGDFYVVVVVDDTRLVYEHTREDNNAQISDAPMEVLLSPPPDLIVTSVSMPTSAQSEDTIEIQYTVENNGAGSPYLTWWRDIIIMRHVSGSRQHTIGVSGFSGQLPPAASYSRSIPFTIPSQFEDGQYTVTVTTDYQNQIFEFTGNQNNDRNASLTVQQSLSDLAVSGVQVTPSISTGSDGIVELLVTWTVRNIGQGSSPTRDWSDTVKIRYDGQSEMVLGSKRHSQVLRGSSNYSESQVFELGRPISRSAEISVKTDSADTVYESNESNNAQSTKTTAIPVVFDLITFDSISMLIESENGQFVEVSEVVASQTFSLEWKVRNDGQYSTSGSRWTDTIYLTDPSVEDALAARFKMISEVHEGKLISGETYTVRRNVTLPLSLFGFYILEGVVDENNDLSFETSATNNLYSSELFVNLPPSPDLIVEKSSFTLLPPSVIGGFSSLEVTWQTINDGNTMAAVSKWRDSVFVSKDQSNPFGAGSALLASFDIEGLLQPQQTYSRNETVVVRGDVFGDVWLFVVSDSGSSIEEINGELNNAKRSDQIISVPRSPQPNLNVIITSAIPTMNATGGDTLIISYQVTNNGGTTIQSSWTDTVRALITDDVVGMQEFLMFTHRRLGSLSFGESYTVQKTVALPAFASGIAYLVVDVDSFRRTLDADTSDNTNQTGTFFVKASDLPDLSVAFSSAQQSGRSGEPITISYIVSNIGLGRVITYNPWYDKLYLSTDSLLDPFDVVLGVANGNIVLPPNGTQTSSISGQIPFDLFSGTHYLLLQTDSTNIVRESDEGNNVVIQALSLLEGFSTDLGVRSIVAPLTADPFQEFTATWEIINNGSVDASGYKCDTVYFSLDSEWQVSDHELGAHCGFVSLTASSSTSNQLKTKPPLVAQQQYHTLVKTRSNIKDANTVNNIATSIGNTTVVYPTLALEVVESISFGSEDFLVWRVAAVPASKTLVVKLTSSTEDSFYEVFVRSREPASPLAFDATGSELLSANQTVIVANTRRGDYYVYARSVGSLTASTTVASIQMLVKIAKFEIEFVSPSIGGVTGSVTLRIDGTLFPPDASVALIHSGNGNRYDADAVYRFSSTQLYATFDFTHFVPDDNFKVEIRDEITNITAIYVDAIRAIDGQRGTLSTRVDNPGALRPNAVGTIILDIQNIGDTDIKAPLMIFSVGAGAEVSIVHRGTPASGNWTDQLRFVGLATEGPTGIIRPKGTSRISFQVRQTVPGAASISISLASFPPNSKDSNPYLDASKLYQPIGFTDSRWSVVWDHVKTMIGPTVGTLTTHLSKVANHLSLVGKRITKADELVAYIANLAEGFHLGTTMSSVTDLSLEGESASSLPLRIHRLFSPRRSHRTVKGPFGRGWTSLYWSLKINGVYGGFVILEKDNEFHQFLAEPPSSNDRFTHPALGVIRLTNDDVIYEKNDVTAIVSYVFSRSTLRLSRVTSSQDGGSITISSDPSGRITKLTTDDGYYVEVGYSPSGLITEIRSFSTVRLLHVASYNYDSKNEFLNRVTFDSDKTTLYEYGTDGGLTKVINPSGTFTGYHYSSSGTSVGLAHHDASGTLLREAKFEDDGLGQLKLTDFPSRQETTLLYNDIGDLALSRTRGSSPIKIVRQGRTLRQTLVDDLILNEENYDPVTGTLKVTNGNGAIVKLHLKENGDLLSLTDAAGFQYIANYTSQSQLSKINYPDGSFEEFLYDSDQQLTAFVNRNKKKIDFVKDTDSKITRKAVEGGETTLMSYYSNGQLREAWSNKSRISFEYDSEKRPIRIEYDRNRAINYRYDAVGRRTALFDDTGEYNVSYIYDIVGRLVAVNNQGLNPKNLLTIGFDSKGKLMQRQTADGSRAQYRFDTNDFKLLELINKAGDGTVIDSFTYSYDKRGRKLNATTSKGTWKYSHDAISQLLSFESPVNVVSEINYDNSKNRQSVTSDGSSTTTTYQVNNLNQYVSTDTGLAFEYDMNGNLIAIKDTLDNNNIVKQFQYDEEGHYIGTRSATSTCTYEYDAISNPKSRTCGSETVEYLIDPFGFHGADVIAEFDAMGNTTFYYHAMEQGLIGKMIKSTQRMYYYQFDDIGSVTSLTDNTGSLVLNRYEYDPFGVLISKSEQIRNEYLFIGQWGVRQINGMDDVFVMRSRLYDATLGRFLRPDSYGFAGRSTNLYCYVENNPLHEKDPRGQFIPLAVLGGAALIGAITNVGVYVATQAATGGFSGASGWDIAGGVAGAAASGALLGAGTAAVAAWAPAAAVGIGAMALVGGVAGLAGSAIEQGINSKPWSWSSFAEAGIIGALTGNIPLKMIGYAGRGASAFGRISNILFKNIMNGATKTGQALWKSMGVAALAGNLAGAFWNAIKPHLGAIQNAFGNLMAGIKNLYDSLLEWIRSVDPNDILGPAGYGDARFVANDIVMSYKIRFENHVNASAPAQKVSIKAILDPDLDVRTFVIDGWGFGNFTFTPRAHSSLLQEVKDLSQQLNFFVRIFAGVNFVTGEAQFLIEALDPLTGQAPEDPRVGFLPPNPENGTDGQGFVAYSIKPKKTTKTYDVIDATASIIFDRNEAIETPPIFNTIDSSPPSLNTSVETSLLDSETLLLNIAKADEGSGLNFVDFFVEQDGELKELATGVNESFVVLPLSPGSTYKIHSSPVDFVGNRLLPNTPGNEPSTIVFPSLVVSCDGVANCSGFGNCTGRDLCACLSGHYGDDCSLTQPPLEPPILTVRPVSAVVNRNITLPLYARLSDSKSQTLTVIIDNVPSSVSLSAGKRNGSRIVLNATEVSNNIALSVGDATFTITITAIGETGDGRTVSRFATLTVTVTSEKATPPSLSAEATCYDQLSQSALLMIMAELRSTSGIDERLYVNVSGIPSGFDLSHGVEIIPGTFSINVTALPNITLFANIATTFTTTSLSISASAVAISSGDIKTVIVDVLVSPCPIVTTTKPTTDAPVPTADDDDDDWVIIVAVIVPIVIILLIIIVVVVVAKKRRNSKRMSLKQPVEMGAVNQGAS